ncbi:cellulose biosynthesis protein BcsQ [Photobacterium damselae]|uniref:cellulose biosynthesis protein BcsQ n=1 Tax=Photobacterium damselae TaxID=38293 RepID=UPI00165EA2B5|nr:cellulose biosynthesis protein BcsQ [Photobacterium damselae]
MKRLLCVSLRPGCGSTTLTANLAQALCSMNKNVLSIDIQNDNLLGLHHGIPSDISDGWALNLLTQRAWNEAGFVTPQKLEILPFGQLTPEQKILFNTNRTDYINTLSNSLFHIETETQESWQIFHSLFVDIDEPSLENFIDSMDAIFVVLTPDALSYSVLHTWLLHSTMAQNLINNKLRFVVNNFQPEVEVSCDFLHILQHELKHLLSPVIVHRDMAILDSVANLTTVQNKAPLSQASKDFHTLSVWTISYMSKLEMQEF